MEGIFFYWTFWALWIVTTFFMSKNNPNRIRFSVIILISIISSSQFMSLYGIQISFVSLFFLLIVYAEVGKMPVKSMVYFLITSFILMMASVSFQLFELFDPVWIIVDRNWMFGLVLTYMTMMLQNTTYKRIISLLFGAVHGEFVYAFILKGYSISVPIGSFRFLDVLAVSLALILAWSGFEKLTRLFEGHVNHLEKGRGRQS